MPRYSSIEELEAGTQGKDFLVPTDIAGILKCDPYLISLMARDENERKNLGFPVTVMKRRTKIPKLPFINYVKGIDNQGGKNEAIEEEVRV